VGRKPPVKADEPTNRLEPLGKRRKEFGQAEGPRGPSERARASPRPYKVDGTGKLARHSAARCSAPEINGPVVQQKFTFLLRETCNRVPPATAGATVSNGRRGAQESAEAVVPRATSRGTPGGSHNLGRAELGGQNTTSGGLVPGVMKPTGRASGSDHRGRERVLLLSARTVRNRRTRTRMYGGVGARRGNPPGDPIGPVSCHLEPCVSETGVWPPQE